MDLGATAAHERWKLEAVEDAIAAHARASKSERQPGKFDTGRSAPPCVKGKPLWS